MHGTRHYGWENEKEDGDIKMEEVEKMTESKKTGEKGNTY